MIYNEETYKKMNKIIIEVSIYAIKEIDTLNLEQGDKREVLIEVFKTLYELINIANKDIGTEVMNF